MPLTTPNLDDRKFQDILDEARRLIPRHCPEWTDHNLSDPGITLLELFAWMTDLLLYRLNRVPDKNYVKFLELIGVRLHPARAATTMLYFRLTAPQPEDVLIPRGTSVATQRTDTLEAITFATDRDLVIRAPRLVHALAEREGNRFLDYHQLLENREADGFPLFSQPPRRDDALYLGLDGDLSGHTLALRLRCPRVEGVGVDPTNPPVAWEVAVGTRLEWVRIDKPEERHDSTGGFNRDGVILLDIPYEAVQSDVDTRSAFWLRCRVTREGEYRSTPRLRGVAAVESLGGLVPASHAFTVLGEEVGTSDGTPGQCFQLGTLPVLPRRAGETLEVLDGSGNVEPWLEVSDFGDSGPDHPHFVLDDVTGTVELGPRIRTPRGTERQFGSTPPQGRRLRFSSYRSGGGVVGNVGADTLTILKSSIPFVANVTNPNAASGGTDAENLDHARQRGPRELRASDRAVTAEDFETLARTASPKVARAHCLMVRDRSNSNIVPGTVRLQLVPALEMPDGPVPEADLEVTADTRKHVQAFLDQRRLLTCKLVLERPAYVWVRVEARLRARPNADPKRVVDEAIRKLYRYIHPTLGGPDGAGWPFARPLYVPEIYTVLQGVAGVDAAVEAVLYQVVNPRTGELGQPTTRITPGSDGLLCSFEHRVEVE